MDSPRRELHNRGADSRNDGLLLGKVGSAEVGYSGLDIQLKPALVGSQSARLRVEKSGMARRGVAWRVVFWVGLGVLGQGVWLGWHCIGRGGGFHRGFIGQPHMGFTGTARGPRKTKSRPFSVPIVL